MIKQFKSVYLARLAHWIPILQKMNDDSGCFLPRVTYRSGFMQWRGIPALFNLQ